MRGSLVAIVGVAAIVLAACVEQERPGRTQPSNVASRTADTPPAADSSDVPDSLLVGDPPTLVPGPLGAPPTEWTTRTTSVTREGGVATVTDFRAATHAGFDRVVLELQGAIPGYHVEYVDRPAYACGSGEAVYLPGDAWLLIRLQPARAHDDAGSSTLTTRRQPFDLRVIREAALTCDFEADVSWVLGLASPDGYRIAELSDPARLVIDLRH